MNTTVTTVSIVQTRLDTAHKYIRESQKKIAEMEERIQNAINSIFDRPPSDDIDMYKMIIKSAKDVLMEEKRQLEMAEYSRQAAEKDLAEMDGKVVVTVAEPIAVAVTVITAATAVEEQKTESPIPTSPANVVIIQSALESSS
jgi:transcription termination factor Rho